ncbi:MAG: hypothetical protein PHQ76_07285 [Caldisericia bacterium]|nr:hypothetical protein [Caldisericia bacterium]MDY0219318.1 hypothetical protein [Candidatus Cloacimonas acidaminovorans]
MDTETMTIEEFLALPNKQQCSMENISKLSVDDLLLLLLDENDLTIEVRNEISIYLNTVIPNVIFESEFVEDNSEKEEIHYPALNTVAIIYIILGWAILIFGIISSIYVFSEVNEISGVVIFISTLFLAISTFAISELIKVLTDMSSFLYQILNFLKQKK